MRFILYVALKALQELEIETCSRVGQKHFTQALAGINSIFFSEEQVYAYQNISIFDFFKKN